MTAPISTPVDGNIKVMWVEAIADPANPTDTELNAGTSLDLSCYLTDEGYQPSVEETAIDDKRLCQRQDFERRGRFKHSLEIAYVTNPTDPSDDDAQANLTPGTEGWIVVREGADYETAFANGDLVDVYPVQCGKQRPGPRTANGVFRTMQKMFITGTVHERVTVA
jgi:hypothetical protein